ncbi:MAG: DUF2520 domain-containing protein [Flavobacteriaceae bacterium TMED206]|nr:MAG: DUF2520 domain-containing protein [Flavobacteriaceae bacterium TMED206]|tara:strand:- start:116 stop:874 length:759 start_codon:yes stop_codon:yes gene_type:complete
MMRISIIGAGKVGLNMFETLRKKKDVKLVSLFNRSIEKILHYRKKVFITNNIKEIKKSDIYIISTKDDSIKKISEKIIGRDGLIVHTSGSTEMKILSIHKNFGVFYPLQTLTEGKIADFKKIPICVEANNEINYKILKKLTKITGSKYYQVDSKQRIALHVSAVFACNFTNYLFSKAYDICRSNKIPFDILFPLIRETLGKIEENNPSEIQTGPAIRKDLSTIKKHLNFINSKNSKKIYSILTQEIIKNYGK